MTISAEEAPRRVRPLRPSTGVATRLLSGTQRMLFAFALVTFGLSSIYTSVALLTRITPALFPGKNLEVPFVSDLTEKVGITAPASDSTVNRPRNLLIVGVDRRPGADESTPLQDRFAGNTDTLMVATIDPVSKTMRFLSFPRDMVIDVTLPRQRPYPDRINASYNAGLLAGHSIDAGAQQLEGDIERNFGIAIDYYVTMDFKGVEKLVNAVGGVDVNVPEDLSFYQWYYSDDDIHAQYITIAAGLQHLDGYRAVAFGRNREPSDFARVKRQQLVLQGVLSKAISQGLLDVTTWPGLWDAYSSTIHTDMPKTTMAGLAPLLHDAISSAKMYSVADPVDDEPSVWPDMLGEMSVVRWDPEKVQYWIAQVFPRAAYFASTVEIENGYALGNEGDVRSASLGRYLKYSKLLPTVNIGPDQPAQAETTLTLYDSSKKELAGDIAKWLNIPQQDYRVLDRGKDTTLPDVVIVIGRNYKIPGN